jgi:hypothetical protein
VNRLADLALVAIGRCGVDVPIAAVECATHGVPCLVGRRLKDPQAERGHLDAAIEGDRFHVLPLR